MTRLVCILSALLAASVAQATSLPDMICAPTPDMRQRLELQFGARQLGSGLYSPEQMMEIWVSDATGDWTLVRSYANGTSCIVAMGEDFAVTDPPPA